MPATWLTLAFVVWGAGSRPAGAPAAPPIDLRATLGPGALHFIASGDVRIQGKTSLPISSASVRVTTSSGQVHTARVDVRAGALELAYPRDFPGGSPLRPGMLFIDAAPGPLPDPARAAEIALLVCGDRLDERPEFPSGFTNNLMDAAGRTDADAHEWPVARALVNLYMRSRAAALCRVGRPDFDLAQACDLAWFKDNLTLYEFDHRDRDWSRPLGHRWRRTFWQAVWDTWFNASNDNPRDGNPANKAQDNYVPYAFANDFPDTLMLYLQRKDLAATLDDDLDTLCVEGLENLMAMQHRGSESFPRRDAKGRLFMYTAGAFRYGMFEDGQWMTEGTGWFHDPEHHDYIRGGVFNARALWCIGEGLLRYRHGPLAERLKETLRLGLRFCLYDALPAGYAQRTAAGRPYWYDAGESGYLLLGMLAACQADPALAVPRGDGTTIRLDELTASVFDAMVELMQPHGQWQLYGDKDPMVIAALADGVRVLGGHPHAGQWRAAAVKAADSWLAVGVDPAECPVRPVHFGSRRLTPQRMSFLWEWTDKHPGRHFLVFYISGHWIHALAKTYALTGDERYRDRAQAIVRYLCGDNPWQVRLLNEMGGVYNWVDDTDGDGVEDRLKQDMYPESTSFCQIGIHHLLRAILERQAR
jgi:hypothetical protein